MDTNNFKESPRLRRGIQNITSIEYQLKNDAVCSKVSSFELMKEESGELLDIDYSKLNINDLCRGCLGIKDVADMECANIGGINVITMYEELTKTKMDTTNVPGRMCPNCILLLSETDQFIKTLKHSFKVLELAAKEIKALQNIEILEPENYNFKKTSILQNAVKERYLVTVLDNGDTAQTEVSSQVTGFKDFLSDDGVGDSMSVHNASDTSDDEIPLAERFNIDVDKVAAAIKKSNIDKNIKNNASRKRSKKTRKKINNNCENNTAVTKTKTRDESENIDSINTPQTCPACCKEVRYFTKHLQSIHAIDWIKAECSKCSYQNADKDALVEHCKRCFRKSLVQDVPDLIHTEKVKAEWKEMISDGECDSDVRVEDEERDEMFEENHRNVDTEGKKIGRPPNSKNKKPSTFECNKCQECYKTYEDIEVHFKLAHRRETTCILCDQDYNNFFSLLYHMMVKHGKLKCCRLCLVSFKNSEELNVHYKSEEHNTKCTVCGEQFKNRKALYEHRRKKHLNPQLENQKYKCPECPKEFANQNNIRRHILVAHNDLRFLCDTCGQSYTTKRNLKLHIQKFHEGLQVETKSTKKNFFCEACGRELKIFHKYAIAMHRAKHKGHNYVCKKCYETFETEEHFKKHVEDLGHQLYECHKCQSQFVREENYKIHLKNHDAPGWNKNMFATWGKSAKLRNEKGEFVCSYCPKVFKDKQRLDNHVRVHTNERPYKCHICGKGFKTWIHRKTHLNIHLGIKKWVCKYCSKAFTNSCTLKGHEMIHTGERPHRCPECKKGFITMSAMKKHRDVHFRSGRPHYGKRATRIMKDEEKTESENEENAEFPYKYEQMFTGSDVSYESFVEPPKAEPVGLISLDKELTC